MNIEQPSKTIKLAIMATTLLISSVSSPAIAKENKITTDKRPNHYQAEVNPKTATEALDIFNNRLFIMKKAEAANDLEAVHELSYDMEAALGKIERQLLKLKYTLEELHLASEEKEAEIVKKNLLKLEIMIAEFNKQPAEDY